MADLNFGFITNQWEKKFVALLCAFAIWIIVNQSITATKTFANVPVRVMNIASDKTIEGLLPNGVLNRRMTITLSGSKNVIENLESSDIEIRLDAMNQPRDWSVQLTKKNLVSLNPEIDLKKHVRSIEHNELLINLLPVVTMEIPVTISTVYGDAPEGYQFLAVEPQFFLQKVKGIKETVERLQDKGLSISFDLSRVKKSELDSLSASDVSYRNDEVSFLIPESWKRVQIPTQTLHEEPLNDPLAKQLRITFLRKQQLPLGIKLPIRVFYPVETIESINPITLPLIQSTIVSEEKGVAVFSLPLFASEVSQAFLDVVRSNMEIAIIAKPKNLEGVTPSLEWSIELINQPNLEDTFVNTLLNDTQNPYLGDLRKREMRLRRRFREYATMITLATEDKTPLNLVIQLQTNGIAIALPDTQHAAQGS